MGLTKATLIYDDRQRGKLPLLPAKLQIESTIHHLAIEVDERTQPFQSSWAFDVLRRADTALPVSPA
jgi:hypothetical protein